MKGQRPLTLGILDTLQAFMSLPARTQMRCSALVQPSLLALSASMLRFPRAVSWFVTMSHLHLSTAIFAASSAFLSSVSANVTNSLAVSSCFLASSRFLTAAVYDDIWKKTHLLGSRLSKFSEPKSTLAVEAALRAFWAVVFAA